VSLPLTHHVGRQDPARLIAVQIALQ